jgi:hypothetical protein
MASKNHVTDKNYIRIVGVVCSPQLYNLRNYICKIQMQGNLQRRAVISRIYVVRTSDTK